MLYTMKAEVQGLQASSALAYYLQMREEESTDEEEEMNDEQPAPLSGGSVGKTTIFTTAGTTPSDKLPAGTADKVVEQRPGLSWSAEEEAHLEVTLPTFSCFRSATGALSVVSVWLPETSGRNRPYVVVTKSAVDGGS